MARLPTSCEGVLMKKIIALLILLFLAGSANAIPGVTGGAQGIHVRNLWVDGNSIVGGTATAGIAINSTGSIGADTTWAAGYDIKAATGSGEIDWSAATGTTKTTTGTNTLEGNTVIAGSKTFTTGTGAIALNGDVTIAATKGITKISGAGNFDFSSGTGTFLTSTGANTLSGDTTISGSKTFTTGTGLVTVNGNVWQPSAKSMNLGGALNVGGLTTTQTFAANGTSTLAAVVETANVFQRSAVGTNLAGYAKVGGLLTANTIAVNSTGTFTGIQTFTAAPVFNGGATVASGQTLEVTTADKLTVGGVIVPQAITIPVMLSASTVNGTVFIPISGNYQVLGVQEVHSVASTAAMNYVNCTIVKVTGTQAPASAGVAVISTPFNLKGTPETILSGTLSTVSGATKVNTTERLGIRFNNPITSLAGGCISISLKRIA
jgi:hypothetical protein